MFPDATLRSLSEDLANSRTTSRVLVEACLGRIEDPAGEGRRAFITADRETRLPKRMQWTGYEQQAPEPSRYAGIPISIKDLFDIGGQVTKAGAKVLSDAKPATKDAPAVARLRSAGFVLIGRANMSEFAFSGLGLNPHFDTPRNPWDRKQGAYRAVRHRRRRLSG